MKDQPGKVRILLVHGHQGSVDSDKYAWFSRFFVRGFSYIEPLVKALGLYPSSSATKSPVAKDYERTMYSWAEDRKVILICGHSHRSMHASSSYAQIIRDNIADLRAKRDDPNEDRREITRKIDRLEDEYEDEKRKGRVVDPLDPDREALPCYFNSGCGLYTSGMTGIEISDDVIRLVKWEAETRTKPKDFGTGKLSEYIEKVVE